MIEIPFNDRSQLWLDSGAFSNGDKLAASLNFALEAIPGVTYFFKDCHIWPKQSIDTIGVLLETGKADETQRSIRYTNSSVCGGKMHILDMTTLTPKSG